MTANVRTLATPARKARRGSEIKPKSSGAAEQPSRRPGATQANDAVVVGSVDVACGRAQRRPEIVERAAPPVAPFAAVHDGAVVTRHRERARIPVQRPLPRVPAQVRVTP